MRTVKDILTALEEDKLPGFDEGTIDLNGRYGAFRELPLHVFAVRGDYEACRILVEAGSEIDIPGEHRFTPLHEAVSQGHVRIVKLLLLHGADPSLTTDLGTTEFLADENPEILASIQHCQLSGHSNAEGRQKRNN